MKQGKALVTGASRGIGKAVAEALVCEGWSVIGTCRNPRRLAAGDKVSGVRYLSLDLSSEKSIDNLIRAVGGGVDLLVNNAGESPIGPAEEVPLWRLRQHFQVNFYGPVALTQAFLPGMRERRSGMLIFVGSIRSEVPSPFSSAYSASKSAARSFAECLRLELAGTGVNVVVIAPWHVRTDLPMDVVMEKKSHYTDAMWRVKEKRDRMIGAAPPARKVAERVLLLLRRRCPPPLVIVGKPIQTFLLRHMPRGFIARMSARVTRMRPIVDKST
jgi:short-subunit dehydrogenase